MTMNTMTAADPETRSEDIVAGNIEQLKALFPEVFTEGKVDFDVLRQLLGGAVEEREEKYGLNWFGKRKTRQLALTPSTGTLRPCPQDSVEWDTTQNIVIEGDNLEVLKLLQKSYAGNVKLIYIDPPYNTGKDFIYPDDYRDNIKNYLVLTGQVDGGQKISSNTESSGRFHTEWLNMMYSRLKLARDLLRDDGALFISIDDGELDNVKKIGVEIFGEENFVGIISVLINPRGRHLDKYIARTHDYLVVFVRNADNPSSIYGMTKEGEMLEEYDKEDGRGKYRELGLRNRNQAFNPLTRPKLFFPLFIDPATGRVSLENVSPFTEKVLPETPDGIKTCWTWGREKVIAENDLLIARMVTDGSWRVYRKDYLESEDGELASTLAKSLWLDKEFNNDYGRKSVKELFGSAVMDFPKSPFLLQRIISISSGPADIVLDFFAGSATTGHAVIEQNIVDGKNRRYILVQFPEPLNSENKEQRVAAEFCDKLGKPRNIAELTKERLRRAAKKIKDENPMFSGDTGFRVFKLDTSNIQAWEVDRSNLPFTLENAVQHLKTGRSEADILYELLLKLGLDLCVPIETRTIAGKTVHSVGKGVLLVCLAEQITKEDAEQLALGIVDWHKELTPAGETTCVFRDSGFVSDVAKSNLAAILEQYDLSNVRSL